MPKLEIRSSRQPWWRSDGIHLLAVLVLGAVFFYYSALALYTFKDADRLGKPDVFRDTITIVGKGTVKIAPDLAILSAGLETTAQGVAAAQKENTEKMNGFLSRAKQLGVGEADRKTTRYTIYPKYEYQKEGDEEKQVKIGDTVMQTVELKVRNQQNLGALMSALGEFGLNQVGSLSFSAEDEETVKKQALAAAILDAQRKAALVSQTSGIKIGKIVSFYESEDFPEPFYGGGPMAMSAEDAGGPAPEPQAGTQEVTVNVTLMYEVK